MNLISKRTEVYLLDAAGICGILAFLLFLGIGFAALWNPVLNNDITMRAWLFADVLLWLLTLFFMALAVLVGIIGSIEDRSAV